MSVSSQTNTDSLCSESPSRDRSSFNSGSSRTSPSEIPSLRPSVSRGESCGPRLEFESKDYSRSLDEEDEDDDFPSVEWLEYIDPITGSNQDELEPTVSYDYAESSYPQTHQTDAFPATSREFADLFPSSRRLEIRHDDATRDGNMNLRIDTTLSLSKTQKRNITLFHLRMQDLKDRQFSLRRYSRDSGREICSCSRKQPSTTAMPALKGSFSNIFASLRPSTPATKLKRQDSGYDSVRVEEGHGSDYSKEREHKTSASGPPDVISLEFANYAHLDVKRRGLPTAKRYDFEYWGVSYSWKRISRKVLGLTEVSYHLVRRGDKQLVAHIVPVRLTDDEAKYESDAGGWIPPCSMWLSDKGSADLRMDVSDVFVATGLVALADDSVRRTFHENDKNRLLVSQIVKSPLHLNLGQIGPKHLLNNVLGRNDDERSRPHSQ